MTLARPELYHIGPWKGRPLIIPPTSSREWFRLAVWEFWMGVLLCGVLWFGTRFIASAPDSIITVFDYSNCYAAPPIPQPCERVAFQTGTLNVLFNALCGLMLIGAAVWLLWELWSAVAPKPITDEFLQLLENSFGRNWRRPRSWPWTRMAWAYGFTLVGALLAFSVGVGLSTMTSSSRAAHAPGVRVETSERFRLSR
jgi:hypothetical protein